MKAGLTWGTYK